MSVIRKGKKISSTTVRFWKTPRNIIVLLMSTIGPNDRKATMLPVEKVPTNASARNESTVEHTLRMKAGACITSTELTAPLPSDCRKLCGIGDALQWLA